MSGITIPPEAVKAAAREITLALVLAVDEDCRACALTDDERKELATAAIRAALAAWPGMERREPSGGGVSQEPRKAPRIILPLPQEETTHD